MNNKLKESADSDRQH